MLYIRRAVYKRVGFYILKLFKIRLIRYVAVRYRYSIAVFFRDILLKVIVEQRF